MENRDRWRDRLDRRGFLKSAAAVAAATIPWSIRQARPGRGARGRRPAGAPADPSRAHGPALDRALPDRRVLSCRYLRRQAAAEPGHGKPVPSFGLRADETGSRPLLGSPFPFHACGQSGLLISDLFPRLGGVADELCVIRSLHTDIVEHFQAVLAMHTGSATVPLPSLGAWISHGLGTFNPNLPSHVVLCEHLPYGGSQVWDSSFLPPIHQGVRIIPGPDPIPDLRPPARPASLRELERLLLEEVNLEHARARRGDAELAARIATFDTARGMIREAPEVLDVRGETAATRALYGVADGDMKSFGYQCLIARRLIERGVRMVELIDTGSSNNWDAHGDMQDHRPKAARVDRAIAALINDLKQRGLLGQTLIAICTEFGRTPWTDGPSAKGRNHYAKAFSVLLAGAGVKGGSPTAPPMSTASRSWPTPCMFMIIMPRSCTSWGSTTPAWSIATPAAISG